MKPSFIASASLLVGHHRIAAMTISRGLPAAFHTTTLPSCIVSVDLCLIRSGSFLTSKHIEGPLGVDADRRSAPEL
jgi:hypothetical protein